MKISFNEDDLRPLVESIVAATLEKLEADRRRLGEKLAYSEPEAAALLGVKPHVLRDSRLRGEITGARVGKGIRYEREELLRFLARQRNI